MEVGRGSRTSGPHQAKQDVNSGGGQWDPPSFDAQGNLYVGVANPAPFLGTNKYPFGSSRPGKNLYTDSIVKLNAKTGKLMWYYQLTQHDIFDWDINNSPILTTVKGKAAVIVGGKAGIVVAVNATNGKLLWTRPVGAHMGPDPGALTEKSTDGQKLPITIEPGDPGPAAWSRSLPPMAPTVFAAINDLPVKYTGQNAIAGVPRTWSRSPRPRVRWWRSTRTQARSCGITTSRTLHMGPLPSPTTWRSPRRLTARSGH